jgi:NitT/TauT family transport system permease protein
VADERGRARSPAPADPTGTPPRQHLPKLVTALALIVMWEGSGLIWGELRFPSIALIGAELVGILSDPAALRHLMATGARIVAALVVSFIAGAGLGLVMGRTPRARPYVASVMHVLQGIPALSWVVFAVLWFRAPEVRIGFILVVVTLPAFALYVDGAVRSIPTAWIELGQAFHADDRRLLTRVILPAIAPEVLTSWKVNLGSAVRAGVVAELIGATLGIGYQLLLAQSLFKMAAAVAWTMLLVAVLLLLQGVITLVERRVLRWRATDQLSRVGSGRHA